MVYHSLYRTLLKALPRNRSDFTREAYIFHVVSGGTVPSADALVTLQTQQRRPTNEKEEFQFYTKYVRDMFRRSTTEMPPQRLQRLMWSVKQLREMRSLPCVSFGGEGADRPAMPLRHSSIETNPYNSEARERLSTNANALMMRKSISETDASQLCDMSMNIQSKVVQLIAKPTSGDSSTASLCRFRLCVQLLLKPAPPKTNPTCVVLDDFNLFVFDFDKKTVRKVYHCGPLGEVLSHSAQTPYSFFEVTVSSDAARPVVQALAGFRCIEGSADDGSSPTRWCVSTPFELDRDSTRYLVDVPSVKW